MKTWAEYRSDQLLCRIFFLLLRLLYCFLFGLRFNLGDLLQLDHGAILQHMCKSAVTKSDLRLSALQ